MTLAGPVGPWSPRLHLCVFCVPGSLALGDGSTDRGLALEEFQGPPRSPCPGDVQRGWDRQGSRLTGSSCSFSLCVSRLQLNLSRPIEEQGPLDVIIHKLTDVILEADQNDSQSLELVHRFQVCGRRGQGGGGGAGNGSVPLRPWSCPAGFPVDTALLLPRRGPVVRPFPAGASVFGGEMGPLVPTPVCRLPLEIRFTDQGTIQSDHALASSVHRWPEPQVLCWHRGGNPLATLDEKVP